MYIPIWLIVLIVMVLLLFYKSKRRQEEFSPFRIQIAPKWYELLKDYKLVDDVTWKQLDEFYSKQPAGYNVFQYGISFAILKSDEKYDLIYNNDWKTFHSRVDFREDVEGIKIQEKDLPHFPFSPKLWIKEGIEGYEIGITTLESVRNRFEVGDDTELVKITTLPYSLFYVPSKRFGVAKAKQIEEQLKKNGWSRDEAHEKFKKDVLFHVPEELEHKYFTVYYEYI